MTGMFAVTPEVKIMMEQQMVCMLVNGQKSFLVSPKEAYVCPRHDGYYSLIEHIIFSSLV